MIQQSDGPSRQAGLYRTMLWSRSVELLMAALWNEGFISGEMHLSTGEEAVAAGVVDHLAEGDALAGTQAVAERQG